jgi:hypothetical protein
MGGVTFAVRIHFVDRSCAALLNWTLEDCHANKGQLTKINQGSPQAAALSSSPSCYRF